MEEAGWGSTDAVYLRPREKRKRATRAPVADSPIRVLLASSDNQPAH